MYPKPLPDYDYLHELFRYEPETGKLYWKIDRSWQIKAGDEVGCISNKGYLRTELRSVKRKVLVHRIIWKMITGREPNGILDHINNNRLDNRFENLREITPKGNAQNRNIHSNNTSGCMGVHYRKDCKKWAVNISTDGKRIHGGHFENIEDAIQRRKELEEEYYEFAVGE